MVLKTAALRLDLPGAPTPTELAGKPSPAETTSGLLHCPGASPGGPARALEKTEGLRRFPGAQQAQRAWAQEREQQRASQSGYCRWVKQAAEAALWPIWGIYLKHPSCSPAFLSSPQDRPGSAQQLYKVPTSRCTRQFGLSRSSLGLHWGLPSSLGPNSGLGAHGHEKTGLLPT